MVGSKRFEDFLAVEPVFFESRYGILYCFCFWYIYEFVFRMPGPFNFYDSLIFVKFLHNKGLFFKIKFHACMSIKLLFLLFELKNHMALIYLLDTIYVFKCALVKFS